MPTRTLTKMSKLCFRFSENQKMKVRRPPKNHQKSMKKRLRKHVGKKSPILVQNVSTWGPTWAPRGDLIWGSALLGASSFSFSNFCCFFEFFWALLGPSWHQLGVILGRFWGHVGTILGQFCNISAQCLLCILCCFCLRFFDFFLFFFSRPGGLRAAL